MELWIPITIFAAFMQNLRSALQRSLKDTLDTGGATFTRFVYGAPLAGLYLLALLTVGGYTLPPPTMAFAVYTGVAALTQVIATALLIYMFSFRNFAAGTAFSKTETVQAALFGVVVLGDALSGTAMVAIMVSLVGVVTLSVTQSSASPGEAVRQSLDGSALIGIASGAFFGISAVCYRAAALSLPEGDFIIRSAFMLVCATVFQTLVMALYMRWSTPGQVTKVLRAWRRAAPVGLAGVLGSAGWFAAMTLQNAAYVRALGQIELVFTFVAASLVFREKVSRAEIVGIGLIVAGILLLVLEHG